MTRNLTCIICPIGCEMCIELDEGRVVSISGNTCKRGEAYAREECICPKRTLTTTVMTRSGKLLSCKSETPINKELIFEAMKIINSCEIDLPISIGDVIIDNVFGSRIIATENME